jgi:hypothetical protein
MKHASLILLPSILLAFGVAQAQTPSAPAQTPPSAQRPPQQTAPPRPTPASPQQTALCSKVAGNVLGAMSHGHFTHASKSFDPKLGADKSKLQDLWKQLTGKFGHLKSVGKSQHGMMVESRIIIVTLPVKFNKGTLAAQVACETSGKVAGLRFAKVPEASSKTGTSSKS